jgi:cysteine synthase
MSYDSVIRVNPRGLVRKQLSMENSIENGATPLLNISFLVPEDGARLMAKCEFSNPVMSLKDRIAKQMLSHAFSAGEIKKGDTVVCASSGNTGCSVAFLGKKMGLRVIIVTSKKCSAEKLAHIRTYGAQLVVVEDHVNYMTEANRIASENSFFNIDQYSNPQNPQAYYLTLGPEIWEQTHGQVSHFVMTGSTFGCISGTTRYLKEKNGNIKTVLADPKESNMHKLYYDGYKAGKTNLELGDMGDFIVEGAGKSKPTICLDFSMIDDVISVTDQQAVEMCYRLAHTKGILVGGSSGLNVHAAVSLAKKLTPQDTVVTVLCDNGVKYLSKIYNTDFLSQNNINIELSQLVS